MLGLDVTWNKQKISGLQHTLKSSGLHKLRKPFQVWRVNVQDLGLIT